MSILRYRLNEQYNDMHQLFARRDDPEVREKLILANINLVKLIAGRFTGYGEPIEDLVQVGIVGLIRAIERYNPERGVRFSVYATPSISGTIKKHLADNMQGVSIPRKTVSLSFAAKRAEESLSQSLARKPTVPEIAVALGVSEKEIIKALWASEVRNTVSLETGLSERDGSSGSSLALVGREDPCIANIIQYDVLAEVIERLKPRSEQIIELIFLRGLKQVEVAKLLNCTRQRIQQRQDGAIKDLRRMLGAREEPKEVPLPIKKWSKLHKPREICEVPVVGERDIRILEVIWPIMSYDVPTTPHYGCNDDFASVPSYQVTQYIQILVRRGVLIREKEGYKKGTSDVQISSYRSVPEIHVRPGLTLTREQKVNLDEIFPSRPSTVDQKLNT